SPHLHFQSFPTRRSSDLTCSDGVYCNGMERWVGGQCRNATLLSCDDQAPCTIDSCDEAGMFCSYTRNPAPACVNALMCNAGNSRSEEHTSELQSPDHLVC